MPNHQSGPLARAVLFSFVSLSAALAPGVARAACDALCQTDFVTQHNLVRTKVTAGVEPGPGGTFQPKPSTPLPPLSWNAAVATDAQNYANACIWAHSGMAGRGENLYASTGSQTLQTPNNAVAGWDSESVLYTYGTIPAPNQNAVGHYTQLVWANTTAVGCGIANCSVGSPFPANFGPNWVNVVCQYTPPGNFLGQTPYAVGAVVPRGTLDVDGNGVYDARTDGLLIVRYLFGLTGEALTGGALGPNPTRSTPAAVTTYLQTVRPLLDVDGNSPGNPDAMTDGLLIMRYLFGLRGSTLTNRAIGPAATRGNSTLIEAYIATQMVP
jgi:pathogenesis-related protein 1